MFEAIVIGIVWGIAIALYQYNHEDHMVQCYRLGYITKGEFDSYRNGKRLAERTRRRQALRAWFLKSRLYRFVTAEKTIESLQVGEMGYTLAWSAETSPDGRVTHIRQSFPVVPQARGTLNTLVRRTRNGLRVDLCAA